MIRVEGSSDLVVSREREMEHGLPTRNRTLRHASVPYKAPASDVYIRPSAASSFQSLDLIPRVPSTKHLGAGEGESDLGTPPNAKPYTLNIPKP